MSDFVSPTIEYFELLPLLVVFVGALVGVIVEAFVARTSRFFVQSVVTLATLVLAFASVCWVAISYAGAANDSAVVHGDGAAYGLLAVMGSIAVDGPTLFIWGLLLVLAVLGAILFTERKLDGGVSAFAGQVAVQPGTESETSTVTARWEQTEVFPLMLFAVSGMLLFASANDLVVAFIALEILSLPLYLLTAMARRRRLLSQEAALKYFLLGAFASAFFLYGAALLYGYAGSMDYGAIAEAIRNDVGNDVLLLTATGLLATGLFFKIGAAPFHAWSPDVYQGAPSPLTAFMSAATKVAAVGAVLRLFHVALGPDRESWAPMMWTVAVISMVVGTLMAVSSRDVKRLLAYSSVAHAGFILVGVLGVQGTAELAVGQISSLQAVLLYLTTYGLTVLGAFAIVSMVRDPAGEVGDIERWAGLGKESPVVAGAFAFLLLAMAGIPLTSGFVGKWAVFSSAMSAGAWPLVVIAVLVSGVAAYIYLKLIVLMYFREPVGGEVAVVMPSTLTTVAIGFTVVMTLVLGVAPDPLLDLLGRAGEFIR